MASSIWVWHGSMAATGRWKEKRGEVRRAPFFSPQSARLPVDGESADMPQLVLFPYGREMERKMRDARFNRVRLFSGSFSGSRM